MKNSKKTCRNPQFSSDPACGTGGFLVSAYDYIRKRCSKQELNDFKKHKIFGVEHSLELLL